MKRKNVSKRIRDRFAPLRLQRVKSMEFNVDMQVWVFMTSDDASSIVRNVAVRSIPERKSGTS